MNISDVIKPAEEKTIAVPREQIDHRVLEYRVYCQVHPKHGAATITVVK